MAEAIEEYKSGADGSKQLRMLARAWNIPKSTLQRRIAGTVIGTQHCSGRKTVLSAAAEQELSNVIRDMASCGFPLGMMEIRKLAYQYSKANELNIFSDSKQAAGYYWFRNFLQRHSDLRVRKPEALSAARAMSMNKPTIDKWFKDYELLLISLGIKDVPSHIWNCDESGLIDQFERRKAVGVAGKPFYQITAGERGELTTVLACMNAVGTYMPLLFIFKGARLQAKWCVGAPAGSLVNVSANGWINHDLFLKWATKFVEQLPKDDDRPHLLLLDGHSSHVYNYAFIQLMKQNNVHLLCFPAHCSHWLQPADKALFKSLKHQWNEQGWQMTKDLAGARLRKDQFFQLFSAVWPRVASVETAQNGFRATGLFPVNRAAIPESAFAPSRCTERELISDQQTLSAEGSLNACVTSATTSSTVSCQSDMAHVIPEQQPGGSAVAASTSGDPNTSLTAAPTSSTVSNQPDMPTITVENDTVAGSNNTTVATELTSTVSEGMVVTDDCQPSTSAGYTSFSELVNVPHRERGQKRKRSRLPTLQLTSPEHLQFIESKATSAACDRARKPKSSDVNSKQSAKNQEKKNRPKPVGRRKKEQSASHNNTVVCRLDQHVFDILKLLLQSGYFW